MDRELKAGKKIKKGLNAVSHRKMSSFLDRTQTLTNFFIFLILLIGMTTKPVRSSVIWRCPDFAIMSCKEPPPDCQSFSMIYLRHGDLECPACLVCADQKHSDPWPEEVRRAGEMRRRRERRRMRMYSKRKRKENRKSNKTQNHDVTTYPGLF